MGSTPTPGTILMIPKLISQDKTLRAYVVGLALGDGNLSNPNGRAQRLRISCDTRYPQLASTIAKSIQLLLPQNRVSFVNRRGKNCVDVSCYSNHWEDLLGWRAGNGSKREQRVSVPRWIFEEESYKTACLRGLLETDGTIYSDRGYRMVMFCTTTPELATDVDELIRSLGFFPRTCKINRNSPCHTTYHVRLSKRVMEFLSRVQPDKS